MPRRRGGVRLRLMKRYYLLCFENIDFFPVLGIIIEVLCEGASIISISDRMLSGGVYHSVWYGRGFLMDNQSNFEYNMIESLVSLLVHSENDSDSGEQDVQAANYLKHFADIMPGGFFIYRADEAETLTYLHMYDVDLQTSVNRIKKFIVDNLKNFDKLLMIKQADFSACKDDTSEAPCVTKWKKIYGDMKNGGAPFTLSQLKINGSDLIESGVPPEKIGAILKSFLYDCVIDTRLNDKKTLIRRAQKLKFD